MGTTPRGIPYPDPTAYVTEGADAMRALAEYVDGLQALQRADDALPRQLFDAAGDLLVGAGEDAAARLARGGGLQVLRVKADGSGLEWATPAAAVPPSWQLVSEQRLVNADASQVLWTNLPADARAYKLVALARRLQNYSTEWIALRVNGLNTAVYSGGMQASANGYAQTNWNASTGQGSAVAHAPFMIRPNQAHYPDSFAEVTILNPQATVSSPQIGIVGTAWDQTQGTHTTRHSGWSVVTSAPLTSLQVLPLDGGPLALGSTFALYALK